MARIRAKKKETRDAVTMGMGTMRTDFLQQSTVQKGAVEEMRTERTKLLTAFAWRGGNVDDGGNDIHDPSPDVNVVGLTGNDCDDENAAAATGAGLAPSLIHQWRKSLILQSSTIPEGMI